MKNINGTIAIGYFLVAGLLGMVNSWLTDQNIPFGIFTMQLQLGVFLFFGFMLYLVLGRETHKHPLFYCNFLWFLGDILFTWAGKCFIWLGVENIGSWIYEHRDWGLFVGGVIMTLVCVYSIYGVPKAQNCSSADATET